MLKRYQLLHRNQAEAFLISVPPILSRAIGFFLIPVYTRILSPAEFGLVSVALAISGVIRLIVLPGIDAVYMRYGFDGYGTPEAKRGHHFGTILRTHLLLLFVFFPVAAIPGIYLAKLSAPDVPITFFLIAVLSTALGSLQAPVIARFTATRQMKRVAAREFTMAALIATGSLTALLGLKWGAVSLLVGELSAALLMIPVSLKDVFSGLSKSHPWRGESVKTVVKSMVSIGPEALMVLSLTSVDRFFLNAVAGPTETGLYVAGYQIGSMVMALVIIAARQWRMIFYQLYFQDKNLNPAIGRQIYRGSFEVFLAITGMLAVLSQPIAYYVLGPKFQMSAQIIPIAVLIAFLRVPMTFVSIYCWTRELVRARMMIHLIALAVFLISLPILVPLFGARGAAWSGVLAMLSFVIALEFQKTDEFKLRLDLISLPGLVSAALLVIGLTGGIGESGPNLLQWVLGAGAFTLTLWQARRYFLMLGEMPR